MLSAQQDKALQAVDKWLRSASAKPFFYLAGYAGTGKTTLARHFAEGVDGKVCFASFTGKAAYVMRQKGCLNATTIHKLIYQSREKSQAHLKKLEAELMSLSPNDPKCPIVRQEIETERRNLARPAFSLNLDSPVRDASLIVIDECSMIDAEMGTDLLHFEVPVLVLGDPAQLPPVYGAGYFTSHDPDVMLTDIHRQARDNPIIAMATTVREGGQLDLGDYGESRVLRREQTSQDDYVGCSQLLVGRNATRRSCNNRARQILRFDDPLPEPGDKLVCLRNNHDLGLLNGSIWHVVQSGGDDDEVSLVIKSREEEAEIQCLAHSAIFRGEEVAFFERRDRNEFDYGYALTVHKAQGSQWRDVTIIDEWSRNDRAKWLYTALTRAEEKVTVVR